MPSSWISPSVSFEPWIDSRLRPSPEMPAVSIDREVEGPPWMFIAGMSSARLSNCRAVGSASKTSRPIDCDCSMLCTSMTGLDSVTVTVSSRAPTAISASTFAVKPVVSAIPSRSSVLKPASEKVTA